MPLAHPARILALASLIAVQPVSAASAPEPLTLKRAVETALAHSRLLAIADADRGAAAATLDEIEAGRMPVVALSETASRSDNPTLVFSNKLGQERFTAADFAVDALNRPDPLTNYRTRLTFEVPLWTAGRLKHQTGAAGSALEAAKLGHESARQQAVHQVVDAFFGTLTAGRRLAAARQAAATVAAQLELVGDLYAAGLVVESDLLQVRVRESELAEEVARAVASHEVGRAALNLTMGIDQATAWRLEEPSELTPGSAPEPLERLLEQARQRRPDLAAIAAQVEAARRRDLAARAEILPTIAGGGFFEANGEDPTAFDGTNWGVEAGLRWTLFDGAATQARRRRAAEELRAAEEHAALLEEQVELEVRRARARIAAARARLEAALRAVDLADRALAIVADRYREGIATIVELREAETALSEAHARQIEAGGDLARSRSALDLAVGRL